MQIKSAKCWQSTTCRQKLDLLQRLNVPVTVQDDLGRTSVQRDDTVRFSTPFYAGRGRVIDLNHGSPFPIKIEFQSDIGKKIVSFSPDEFTYFEKEHLCLRFALTSSALITKPSCGARSTAQSIQPHPFY